MIAFIFSGALVQVSRRLPVSWREEGGVTMGGMEGRERGERRSEGVKVGGMEGEWGERREERRRMTYKRKV